MTESRDIDVADRPPMGGLRIGRLLGVDIAIDASWLIIAALIILSLGTHFRSEFPRAAPLHVWLAAGGAMILFFGSILVHELAHSLVARAQGLPVHGITLFVFGGVSRLAGEPRRPVDEFVMAVVGPAASVLLGVAFLGAGFLLPSESLVRSVVSWLGVVNLVLAGFNLIPGFPLDGGRVLRAVAWGLTGSYRKATHIAATAGAAVSYSLIVLGIVAALGLGALIGGLWLAFIGWFLLSAVKSSRMQAEFREALGRLKVGQAMARDCAKVGEDESLSELVEHQVLGEGRRCFLVSDGRKLVGLLTLGDIRRVPRERWSASPVRDVMVPAEEVRSVAPDDTLLRAMEIMAVRDASQLPVVTDGDLVGVISREDVLKRVALLLEIENGEPR